MSTPAYPRGNLEVIGGYLDRGAGTPSGGEAVAVEVLDWSGNWSMGTYPGTVSVTLDGSRVPPGQMKSMLSPNTAKALRIGDGQAWLELRNLWVETADPDQWDEGVAQIRVVLQDRRIWWHRRPPMGPRAYNIEQFNERQNPYAPVTSFVGKGNNERMCSSNIRTAIDIILEIMVYLGEDLSHVKVAGGDGWQKLADVSSPFTARTMELDTPEFILGDGASPVEALEKILSMYGLLVGISPDSLDCGFILASDIPAKLPQTKAAVESLMQRPLNPVEAGSVGYDREHLPDMLWINGSSIVIGDLLVLEPVARDPDRPERFIPLHQISTLEAYGFDMSKPGLRHLRDGLGAIIFATAVASAEDPMLWSRVPPEFLGYMKEWFRIWQVAGPREHITEASWWAREQIGTESRDARRIDLGQDPKTHEYRYRWRSPVYRFTRRSDGGSFVPAVGALQAWRPSENSVGAGMGRWMPLLPHTEHMLSDGSYAKLRVYGTNVLMPGRQVGFQGAHAGRWGEVGKPVPIDANRDPYFSELADLGLEPGLVDSELGIVDLGEQVFGHDGTGRVFDDLQDFGLQPCDLWKRERIAQTFGHPELLSYKAPLGQAFLVLHCAFHKKSHGTTRDFTTSYSTPSATRAGDPIFAWPPALRGLREHLITQAALPSLPDDSSGDRSYPGDFYQTALPDLELRCSTTRAMSVTSEGRRLLSDEPTHSFVRRGGWQSGSLEGRCWFYDISLRSMSLAFAHAREGYFSPVSLRHYNDLWDVFRSVIERFAEGLKSYRATQQNIRCINAEICGVWRMFFPGVVDFAANPCDAVAFSGSGDGVNASMRLAVNSRGWRPYVNSAMDAAQRALYQHRANASMVHRVLHGGGAP